ncbi:MAG: T9SS type A sorting domain-containing protein, partial [Bacteroidetes bacterium]|nr:T9SS type A sorting domain-containing protein [Bacteroidota bacterium]
WVNAATEPNSPTITVTIQNGHMITYTQSNKEVNNLVVETGGKIYRNHISSYYYLNVYGNITCDGTIGNGSTYDCFSLHPEGINMNISGSGECKFGRIYKNTTTNTTTNLTLDIDVEVYYNSTANAVYNNAASTTLNIIINPGYTLELHGTIEFKYTSTRLLTLLINSDATGTGALLDNGVDHSDANNTSVEQYLVFNNSGNTEYHFVSIPVANHLVENSLNNYYVYPYNETNNSWSYLSTGDNLEVGKGYAVFYSGNQNTTVTFSETLNTGDQTIAVTKTNYSGTPADDNWNLVGNPFPSPIDWDDVTPTNIESAIYTWNSSTLVYASYSSGTGTNGYNNDGIIPAMQGFFVHATNSGNFTIPQSARVNDHSQGYLKNAENISNVLRLKTAGNGYNDETIVRFIENASNGFDGEYDAYKFFSGSDSVPQLYTHAVDNNKLSINALPFFLNTVIVPLNFEVGVQGEYSITATGLEGFSDLFSIVLEDLLENITHDLLENPVYEFSANPDDDEERFLLHFDGVTLLDELFSNNEIEIYSHEEFIYIKNNSNESIKGEISIYNILGQNIYSATPQNISLNRISPNCKTGNYIVKLQTGNNVYTQKIFIK